MQLNEIIEKNTLPEISSKTRLSVENLEKLFKQDFSGFRKVQALGFISILEREYRADLSDIRTACRAYFADTAQSEPESKIVEEISNISRRSSPVSDMAVQKKWPSFIKPLVVVILAIGLLYTAWQTYSTSMQDVNTSSTDKDVGFFDSIIQQATSWVGSTDEDTAKDVQRSNETDTLSGGEDNGSDNTFVIEDKPKSKPADTSTDTKIEDQKETQNNKEKQPQIVPDQTQAVKDAAIQKTDEAIASASEDNSTQEIPLATEVPSITGNTTVSNDVKEAIASNTETPSKPSLSDEEIAARKKAEEEAARLKAEEEAAKQKALEEQALREREARQKAAEEKAIREREARKKAAQEKIAREKAAKAKAAKAKAARAKIVILKPRKKAWFGIVNLTNMKRRVATSLATQTFDTNKGRWIVATGHGFIDYDEGLSKKKLNDGKKHFLLIENGKVKEISHEEFQRLNKSKVW